ncbi:TBC1 domain family member 19 [Coccinella septempunctata]|uniref:TBC1 domain family member 19 n=1 Tax=Coccinella septempunctata TaxID=41139 RepID=UPI001D0877EC|nr:TBC1 domain family member 19 [Coccinella septempunctata]
MDESKENSIHHMTLKICEEMKRAPFYPEFYNNLQKLVASPTVKYENFKETLLKSMKMNGLESEIKNNIYHWLKYKKREVLSPYDAFFRKAQIHWDRRIHKSLNSMSNELGISLVKIRTQTDMDELLNKWNELSNYEVNISKYRPVYAPKDFLEVLLNLKGPISNTFETIDEYWEFAQIPLRVKNLDELRNVFVELARGDQILGVNFPLNSINNYASFEMERIAMGEKVLEKNYAPVAQEYLKKGSPRCLRSKIWALILGSEVKQPQKEYFQKLKSHVLEYDLMIDKLIIKDINLTASNDDQYFVFEDVLYQVMLCFSRDGEILKDLPTQPGFMQVVIKGRQNTAENTLIFPPSGVIPFHGFTMYAAPFCYLYEDPVQLYFTFRAFYLRFWHRLHRVCGHPQGIVSLCLQFERMLQCYEPNLWHHFKKCHIHPLRIVIKWIMRAFSGHLNPEQLLTLWDIILAYDSLEIIPMLAVVILIFRKENLYKVTTLQNLEAVLADLSSIAVIPLLQIAFSKEYQ